jgi:hypothetical protein
MAVLELRKTTMKIKTDKPLMIRFFILFPSISVSILRDHDCRPKH